ncbi:Methyl-accepting chemotaxis protein II [Gemmata obscuriglobus]|uniref:PAS domain S-box protein n=1 Tax=Gemmata obscuriglobus TaxID=114 RepID=A0A2Z3GVK0_9BACT|nr:methyl-accepting chemotaxis protein [Gemmata obscuriglobus]AWM36102.1 PAS domain S-box protein [Gemmata obscuriglobus]QEG31313.1 Methyl-accepting chemotaxis protein II [Gemmata obscuriglobus]VTS10652.1 chemotaxis protein : Globin-coupled methyl-accepting chemotaxis protein (Modular protein) OS=Candidatus Nitrospira defluvii GN=cheM PE=3 SV=1: PAS_9: MCPsignal [Gemmata obscuriglobus UQM 2246]
MGLLSRLFKAASGATGDVTSPPSHTGHRLPIEVPVQILDAIKFNVMYCDTQFVIRYANPATIQTLKRLQQYLPIPAESLVGSSIDVFHKRPAHQRGVLASASTIPPVTNIRVGPETLELRVQPVFSVTGARLGTLVTWDVITRQLELEATNTDSRGQIESIKRSFAVIEFEMNGNVRTANDVFLKAMGYTLAEIKGRHHSMFVDQAYAASAEYREFWAKLNRGESVIRELKRVDKAGQEVWLQASYNPIMGADGKPYKVVKFATDLTEQKRKAGAILSAVNRMASGDFAQTVPSLGDDLLAQVGTALNEAIGAVRSALESVREVSEQLADAAAQLSSASEEISTGAQQQASSLEETASTLHEITATVRQSADSAQQARQLANGSREVAERGGSVVSGAVEAMGEINASSKKIAEIITTIDEIAFQTNLLALNAAVEAARAGEQGRGFAVVAAEVRNLAQRSATAAKEIKGLIGDSVKKVDAGTDLVNRSGATLAEIVSSVKRVTEIVAEIASASKDQASGIEQVNKAVGQMDTVTQRNASQTEEMSATAQTLTDQAAQLRELVARFKLGAVNRPSARKASPKARSYG